MNTEITTKDLLEREIVEEAEGNGNTNEENEKQGADSEVDEEEAGGEEEEELLVNPGAAVWADNRQPGPCLCPSQAVPAAKRPPRLKPPSANQFTYPQANTETSLHSP